MALQLHEKISVAEARQWLLTAHEEWTGEHTDSLDEEDLTALYAQIAAMKPVDFKTPRKPRTTKVSPTDTERMEADYDEGKCDARIWLKGGFAAQCSCKKLEGQFLCKRHEAEAEAHGGETKNGSFNAKCPTHKFDDESNDPCWWSDQLAEWVEKKTQKGEKPTGGSRGPRKCGCCGELGHDKRKCPNNTDQPSIPMTVADLEAALAVAKEAATKAAEAKAAKAEAKAAKAATKAAEAKAEAEAVVEASDPELEEDTTSPTTEGSGAGVGLTTTDEAEAVVEASDPELEEDTTSPTTEGSGADVGLTTTEEADGYQSDTTQAYASPSDEENVTGFTRFTFDGVEYSRDAEGVKAREDEDGDNDEDYVGKWVGDKIEFTRSGSRIHRMLKAAGL
jgi:hypothetical protein